MSLNIVILASDFKVVDGHVTVQVPKVQPGNDYSLVRESECNDLRGRMQRGFPTVRILDRAVSQEVSSLIVDDALGGAFSTLPLAVLSPPIRYPPLRSQKTCHEDRVDLLALRRKQPVVWHSLAQRALDGRRRNPRPCARTTTLEGRLRA